MSAIGPKRTFVFAPHTSAFGAKADISLGQVYYSYYIKIDDVVTLSDPDGKPAATKQEGNPELAPNEDVRAVACKMRAMARLSGTTALKKRLGATRR
jgi:hypothetical protein